MESRKTNGKRDRLKYLRDGRGRNGRGSTTSRYTSDESEDSDSEFSEHVGCDLRGCCGADG